MNDLRALSRDLRSVQRGIVGATNETTAKVANVVRAKAVERSSGSRTAKDRRAADYPFARRHGSPLWDPSTINVGKGEFRAAWVVDSIPGPMGIYRRGVANRSEVAAWLEQGTERMFERPLKEILEKTRDEAWERIAPEAFERALKTAFQR